MMPTDIDMTQSGNSNCPVYMSINHRNEFLDGFVLKIFRIFSTDELKCTFTMSGRVLYNDMFFLSSIFFFSFLPEVNSP